MTWVLSKHLPTSTHSVPHWHLVSKRNRFRTYCNRSIPQTWQRVANMFPNNPYAICRCCDAYLTRQQAQKVEAEQLQRSGFALSSTRRSHRGRYSGKWHRASWVFPGETLCGDQITDDWRVERNLPLMDDEVTNALCKRCEAAYAKAVPADSH